MLLHRKIERTCNTTYQTKIEKIYNIIAMLLTKLKSDNLRVFA